MKKKKTASKKALLHNVQKISLLAPPIGLVFVSLIGFLGAQWWLFDIFSNFRFQYAWIALAFVIFYLSLKSWKNQYGRIALLSSIAALIINSFLVGALWFPMKQTSEESELTVLFSNIFVYNNQSAQLLRFIKQTDPDVIALAEVNDRMYGYYAMQLKESYPYSFHKREKRLFGVAVFSKTPPSNQDVVQYFSEDSLPSLKLDLTVDNKPFRFYVTHPYPPMGKELTDARNHQLLGAADTIGQSNTPTLIIGDFNMTPWSPLFQEILNKGKLHNSMSGMGLQTSWPAWLPKAMRIPIDHALYTDGIEVVNRYRGPVTGSDHRPIVVELRVD